MLHCIVQHPRRCFWLLQFIVDAARHDTKKDGLVNVKLKRTETWGILVSFLPLSDRIVTVISVENDQLRRSHVTRHTCSFNAFLHFL